jgi:hypothetical protein
MASAVEPEWNDSVEAADWIAERLTSENWPQITSFVPRGLKLTLGSCILRMSPPMDPAGSYIGVRSQNGVKCLCALTPVSLNRHAP